MGFYSQVKVWLRQKQKPGSISENSQELKPQEKNGDSIIAEQPLEIIEQPGTSPRPDRELKISNWGGYWIEWLVIFLAVTFFCVGILDLRAASRLPGNESEVFQMLDWTLGNSLRDYGKFPLGNPSKQSGVH